jgi:hypothetical protein
MNYQQQQQLQQKRQAQLEREHFDPFMQYMQERANAGTTAQPNGVFAFLEEDNADDDDDDAQEVEEDNNHEVNHFEMASQPGPFDSNFAYLPGLNAIAQPFQTNQQHRQQQPAPIRSRAPLPPPGPPRPLFQVPPSRNASNAATGSSSSSTLASSTAAAAAMQILQQRISELRNYASSSVSSAVAASSSSAITAAAAAEPNPPPDDDEREQHLGEVWHKYRPANLPFEANDHPGDTIQGASMASVQLPPATFDITQTLKHQIERRLLSSLQFEGVLYACQRHQQLLSDGVTRAGFYIGDSAGIGKGRQIASVIYENVRRGLNRHVWVSTSIDLHLDATRDFNDIEVANVRIIRGFEELDKLNRGKGSDLPKDTPAILFTSYSMISRARGKTDRFKQLCDFLGDPATFEGVIAFDECHKCKGFKEKNSSTNEQGRKEPASTATGQRSVELQKHFPLARVLYCSATGITNLENMQFMVRLGFWGQNAPFANFDEFKRAMGNNQKIALLELLGLEMKLQGSYVSRSIGYAGSEFNMQIVKLRQEDILLYRKCTEYFALLLDGIKAAEECAQESPDIDPLGRPVLPDFTAISERRRRNAHLGALLASASQRFFKQLCLTFKVREVVARAKQALADGHCVVIGLQSTGEAGLVQDTERNMLARMNNEFVVPEGEADDDLLAAAIAKRASGETNEFISLCQCIVLQFLDKHFPVNSAEIPPRPIPDAVEIREELRSRLYALKLPPVALDDLIDQLGGPTKVAEMSGRRLIQVREGKGESQKVTTQKRTATGDCDSVNIHQKTLFNKGEKLVAIISAVASTGISLHASEKVPNQRRRVHITLELPWAADSAIQQLGRTHRTNQVSAPIYVLVSSGLGGENRFVSAVATRLKTLGALTQADRRAGTSAMAIGDFDFNSKYGSEGMKALLRSTAQNIVVPGVNIKHVLDDSRDMIDIDQIPASHSAWFHPIPTAIAQISESKFISIISECVSYILSLSANKDVTVNQFLNRVLMLPPGHQAVLFNYFAACMQNAIKQAKATGKFDMGVSFLSGRNISRVAEPEVFVASKDSVTMLHRISVDHGFSLDDAMAKIRRFIAEDEERTRNAVRTDVESLRLPELIERMEELKLGSFYISRNKQYGVYSVCLGLRKPNNKFYLTASRPRSEHWKSEVEVLSHEETWARTTNVKDIQELWNREFTDSETMCCHGRNCKNAKFCQYGKRITKYPLLVGNVVRIWKHLDHFLRETSFGTDLGDSEKKASLKIIRAEFTDKSKGSDVCGVQWSAVAIDSFRDYYRDQVADFDHNSIPSGPAVLSAPAPLPFKSSTSFVSSSSSAGAAAAAAATTGAAPKSFSSFLNHSSSTRALIRAPKRKASAAEPKPRRLKLDDSSESTISDRMIPTKAQAKSISTQKPTQHHDSESEAEEDDFDETYHPKRRVIDDEHDDLKDLSGRKRNSSELEQSRNTISSSSNVISTNGKGIIQSQATTSPIPKLHQSENNNELPEGWARVLSRSRPGQYCYVNKDLKKRQFSFPKASDPTSNRESSSSSSSRNAAAESSALSSLKLEMKEPSPSLALQLPLRPPQQQPQQQQQQQAVVEKAPELPPGWTTTLSRSRPGDICYLNLVTGHRQFRFPSSEPTPAKLASLATASAPLKVPVPSSFPAEPENHPMNTTKTIGRANSGLNVHKAFKPPPEIVDLT